MDRIISRLGAAGRTALAATAGLAAVQAGPGVTALGPVRRSAFPRLAGRGAAGHVALTFDDGPDPVTTPDFLDVLASRRVQATFFLLGCMVAKAPGLAADIAAAGHELGVHGWDHRCLPLRGPGTARDDLARARDVIAGAAGTAPQRFRPPYGVLSTAALAAGRRLGLTPVLWTCWGREWTPGATPGSVYAVIAAGLTDGATVLLHDSDCTSRPGSARAALGALPMLLDECARRDLRVGPLDQHGLRLPGRVTGRPARAGDRPVLAGRPGAGPAHGSGPAGGGRRPGCSPGPAGPGRRPGGGGCRPGAGRGPAARPRIAGAAGARHVRCLRPPATEPTTPVSP